MLLEIARQRRILFVGGKGGVGKTSVSSALALARARDAARVLLVSTDPAHNLGHIWERDLSDAASRLVSVPGGYVDGIEIDPQATIERHFDSVAHTMTRLLPERLHASAKQHLELAKAAPGSHESAVLERIAELVQTGLDNYDLVIFDTAPTGHTLHLLTLPQRLTSWTETLLANRQRSERFAAAARGLVGTKDQEPSADAQLRRTLVARRDRFAAMREAVVDEEMTGFVVVCVAEKLPVAESIALGDQLTELGIDVASVIVNRRSPADAGALLAERRGRENGYLRQLQAHFAGVPLTELPLLARDMAGEEALSELAALLAHSR